MKTIKKIGTIAIIGMVGLVPAFSFHVEGKGSVNGMGVSGEVHGEMNQDTKFYCPDYYRPVTMKVTFSDGYTETVKASNECFAHLEIRKLVEVHGRVVNKEVIKSDVEQPPEPMGFKGEMESETHGEVKERNRERHQNSFSGETEFHGEIEIYSSMSPEKVKIELEKAGFDEGTINKILEVYDKPQYVVRTIFVATNGEVTIKTSNTQVVDILKDKGFKVELIGEAHSMKSNDERENRSLFREHRNETHKEVETNNETQNGNHRWEHRMGGNFQGGMSHNEKGEYNGEVNGNVKGSGEHQREDNGIMKHYHEMKERMEHQHKEMEHEMMEHEEKMRGEMKHNFSGKGEFRMRMEHSSKGEFHGMMKGGMDVETLMEVTPEDIEKAQEEVQQLMKEKDKLIKEVEKERVEIRQEIREVKRELIQKLRQKKRLDEQDREKVIQVIKDALRLKLEELKLMLVEKQNSNSDLVELLNAVEGNGEVKEDNTLKYIAIIDKLEEQLKNANTVTELKVLVMSYIKLKHQIKMELKGNVKVNNNSVKAEGSGSVTTQ